MNKSMQFIIQESGRLFHALKNDSLPIAVVNVHGVLGSCVGLVRLRTKRQVGQDILLHVHGTWSWIYGQMERYQECIYACFFFFNLVLPGSIINDVYRFRLNNPTTFCLKCRDLRFDSGTHCYKQVYRIMQGCTQSKNSCQCLYSELLCKNSVNELEVVKGPI